MTITQTAFFVTHNRTILGFKFLLVRFQGFYWLMIDNELVGFNHLLVDR